MPTCCLRLISSCRLSVTEEILIRPDDVFRSSVVQLQFRFLFLTGHSCLRLGDALLHTFVVTHVFSYLFDEVWAFSSDLWHELN